MSKGQESTINYLLFYGIDRKDHENPNAVIKEFLCDILKISPVHWILSLFRMPTGYRVTQVMDRLSPLHQRL